MPPAPHKLSVVLVDDSASVLARLAALIGEIEGADVVGTARSGPEAIRVVHQARPDLVLLDIVMPDMDGLSTLRLLKAQQPEVRVAMVTSVGGAASRGEEAFRLGAVHVLGKPVDPEDLAALLAREREAARARARDERDERDGREVQA